MKELFEVSEYAPKPLKEMEKIINKISKNPRNSKYIDALKLKIQEVTGIKEVYIVMTGEYNAAIMPIYKTSSFPVFIKSIIQNLSTRQDVISPNNLKNLIKFTDQNKYIEKVYIYIGNQLFYDLTSAEVMSILLHEFGHMYITLVNGSSFFFTFLKQVPVIGSFLFVNIQRIINWDNMNNDVVTFMSKGIVLFLLLRICFVHGIKFTQHALEYKSDNFALKYGYGDELISVLMKFSMKKKEKEKIGKTFSDKLLFYIKKIFESFSQFLNPSSHPTDKNRIESLKNQIFNEYRHIYPNYKEFIDVVQMEYNKTLNDGAIK